MNNPPQLAAVSNNNKVATVNVTTTEKQQAIQSPATSSLAKPENSSPKSDPNSINLPDNLFPEIQTELKKPEDSPKVENPVKPAEPEKKENKEAVVEPPKDVAPKTDIKSTETNPFVDSNGPEANHEIFSENEDSNPDVNPDEELNEGMLYDLLNYSQI